jgi:hypothetical protein
VRGLGRGYRALVRFWGRAALALIGALSAASCGDGSSAPSFKTNPVVVGTGLKPEHAAAASDGKLWIAAGDRLASVDPRSRKLATDLRRVGGEKDELIYDVAAGDAGVWAAVNDGSDVAVVAVDPRTGRRHERFALDDFDPVSLDDDSDPLKLAVGAGRVWAAAYDDVYVTIVDPETGKQQTANTAGIEDVAAGGGYGWLITEDDEPGSSGGSLDRIDPRTAELKAFMLEDSPVAVVYGAGGVWVLFEESVKRFDTAAREVAEIELGGIDANFGDIAVSGDTVWVVAGTGRQAVRIDAEANKIEGDPILVPTAEPNDLVAVGDSAWITVDGQRPLRIGPG